MVDIYAVFMMGGLGLLVGVGLAAASKIFYVYVDPMILAVDDVLPGANCGGCGFPGCSANAEAIVAGTSPPNSCVAAGPEVAEAIAEVLGVTVEATEPDIAKPGCTYGVLDADVKYFYDGLSDCNAASLLSGGMKVCEVGCLGLGSCAKACPFGAITMGADGLPAVDEKRCTGCGTCERVCPKHIIRLSSVTRRIMREYTIDECTTPCQRACPAGIDISEYIRQITLGDYHRSVQVIKERNPFPSVVGRICPRPCELECRRRYVDEPVAINFLKRFAADFERENGTKILPYKAPATHRKVAVIGGGVEGLSAAYFAARLGHEATVFEATSKPGGLLRSAISKERLPREILDRDIDGVVEMGVTILTQEALGKEFTIDSLLERGFEAIFLASGGWDNRLARGGGSDVEEVIPGIYLLLDIIKFGTDNRDKISCGPDAVIAGGGELALEAARICKRLGAKNITIMSREAKAEQVFENIDIKTIEKEGIRFIFNAGISRLHGEKSALVGLDYIETDSLKEHSLPVSTLIVASGRLPELIFVRPNTEKTESDETQPAEDSSREFLRWEGIVPYKQPAYNKEIGLFAEGDVMTDFSAAIKAIGAGRRAAASIHRILYDIELTPPGNVITPQSVLQNVDSVEDVEVSLRQIMPLGNHKDIMLSGGEIEKGFTKETAQAEASRCLQCGLVCYKRF